MDPEKKSLNFIFPTKYVIPKSLKFSNWLSQTTVGSFKPLRISQDTEDFLELQAPPAAPFRTCFAEDFGVGATGHGSRHGPPRSHGSAQLSDPGDDESEVTPPRAPRRPF